ncbi:MAG TPA: YihY/virulence factor BrkB family protein [Streptosporangiaceae bacterium]|nr:YihY/virulence factor BrkB family protein [Streptosporangiaceae bacterium]
MDHLRSLPGRADELQQRWAPAAFCVAVGKKFSDDRAGTLAALVAYYAFVSIFPMLLVLITVLQLVLRDNPALRERLVNSALHAYPVIGPQLSGSVHALRGTGIALVIGLLGALLGARGVAVAIQNALGAVWAIPPERSPGFPRSFLRAVALVVVIGLGQMLTAFLSGVAGGLGHLITGAGAEAGTVVLSFVANIGVFWAAFRLGTAGQVSWRDLRLAAVLSAACWQVLLLVGSLVVNHLLHHSSALYGIFGVVLGLLAWLYLQAQITLYAVEAATVRAWRLWPRGLGPPPTDSDRRAYEYYLRRQRTPPA